jgi:DNA-directed RNA polymerase subunit E'/Rpb7
MDIYLPTLLKIDATVIVEPRLLEQPFELVVNALVNRNFINKSIQDPNGIVLNIENCIVDKPHLSLMDDGSIKVPLTFEALLFGASKNDIIRGCVRQNYGGLENLDYVHMIAMDCPQMNIILPDYLQTTSNIDEWIWEVDETDNALRYCLVKIHSLDFAENLIVGESLTDYEKFGGSVQ